MAATVTLSSPASLGFQLIRRRPQHLLQRTTFLDCNRDLRVPTGLGCVLVVPAVRRMRLCNRLIVPFAAFHDESSPSEADVEKEKDHTEQKTKESQEALEQMLVSFKEQALKLQSVSQEAYETYSKKATVVLSETAEKLKIEAEKAKDDIILIAKDLGEEGQLYLATAAERSPEPVKDVMETFTYSTTEDLNHISKVQDFYVGVPYGAILSFGGFLNFMVTGSIPAIRFGMILGGILLCLSVWSLRLWKNGETSSFALTGQAAIAGILFLRQMRLLFQGPTVAGVINAAISGTVAAFFVYRINCKLQAGKPNLDAEI